MVRNKLFILVSILITASIVLAACALPKEVVKTVVVTEKVIVAGTPQVVEKVITATPAPVQEKPAFLKAEGMVACKPIPQVTFSSQPAVAQSPALAAANASSKVFGVSKPTPESQVGKVYRVGVFEDVTSLNFWQANGPDNTVWNSYMLPGRLSMFALSDVTFTFVPFVAAGMLPPLTEENGKWVTTVKMRQDVKWSDGTPFTAEDVAFTANTVLKFGFVGGSWQHWYDANFLESVQAIGPYTVKYIYLTRPGLARHEYGTLQAPIVSKAYWEPKVTESAKTIDALASTATAEEKTAAQAEAQKALMGMEPDGEPLAGAFNLQKWETGTSLELASRDDYFYKGTQYKGWGNGAYEDSTGFKTGTPEGDPVVSATVGPYVDSVIYTIYSSPDTAIMALKNGELDFILDLLGLQRGLWTSLQDDPNLTAVTNPTNGFRFLSFNNRRRPMNDCAFRQAVAMLIDKEFVTSTILQGVANPVYSFVPEGNKAWYFADTPKLGQGLSREDRIKLASAILEGVGYKWEGDKKPTWDADNSQVVAGGRLLMPDGIPVPALNMLAPSPDFDPLRATFAIWIETWLNEFGIPVTSNLVGFNVLISKVVSEQDFDMCILGWNLSIFPSYLRDFFSEEQAKLDGDNFGGYINPDIEELSKGLLTCDSMQACKELSDKVQMLLATELPYVLLMDTSIYEAFRSSAVEFPYTQQLSGLQYTHQQGWTQLQTQVKMK
jgi:ABC-type transport system substrate-binding protein